MIPSVHAHPALLGQLADLSRRDGTAVRPFLFFSFLFFFFFFFSFFLSFFFLSQSFFLVFFSFTGVKAFQVFFFLNSFAFSKLIKLSWSVFGTLSDLSCLQDMTLGTRPPWSVSAVTQI